MDGVHRTARPAAPPRPLRALAQVRKARLPAQRRSSWLLVCAMWTLILYPIIPLGLDYGGAAVGPVTMPIEGTLISRSVWISLLAFGLAVIVARLREALRVLRHINLFLLLFLALSICSVLWSIEPTVTMRRFVRVLAIASDGFAFALLAKSPRDFQGILRPALTTFLIASIIFVLIDPQLATEQPNLAARTGAWHVANLAAITGAWHGLAPQKNVLGSLSATAFLLWLHAALSRESAYWKAVCGMLISALCLLESRSATSLMGTVFASGLLFFLLHYPVALKRIVPFLLVIFASVVVVYSLAVLNLIPGSYTLLSPIAALTGKDLTFTGRSDIWQIIEHNISFHPLLGGGYGAYWTGLPQSPSMEMLVRLFYYPTESHNGYLDVINDLGYVGFACLLGYLVVYLAQAIRLFFELRLQGGLYLTLFFEQLIGNLSEARWFNSLSTDFALMTIATMAMAKLLVDARSRRQRVAAPATSRGPPRVRSSPQARRPSPRVGYQ